MADSTSGLTGYQIPDTDTNTKTSNGTTIVKGTDNTLDKNAFLKILTAELANQDPLNSDNDPTKYVSQLATFSSLEQMANLNGTMSLNSASSLVGKTVKFKDTDSMGNNYEGVINSVTKNGDTISLNFNVTEGGQQVTKTLDYNDVISVEPDSDSTTDSSKAMSLASNLIGKDVKFSDTDSSGNNYEGVITSVSKSGSSVTLNFYTTENGKVVSKALNYNNVISVEPDQDLSDTSSNSLSTASNLIGKTVTFSDTDSNGKQYSGVVKSVVKNGTLVGVGIDVTDSTGKTTTKYFSYNDVITVGEASSSSATA